MCLMLGGGGLTDALQPQFAPTAECKMHKTRI